MKVRIMGAAGLCALALATGAQGAELAGKPILGLRLRFEGVDQDRTPALTDQARALTLRTVVGWETKPWHGLSGLVEAEDVRALLGRYAVNVPGAQTPPLNGAAKARYPLVNDPETTELNRLQLTWTAGPDFSAVIGRQRLNIDDQRFVGGVAWRQDEQTFDAVRLDLGAGPVMASYAYVDRVNRVLGEDRDWRSDSHLLTVGWAADPRLKLQAFVYALDFADAPANSSLTRGVKLSGGLARPPWRLAYEATYARQSDWRNTPDRYDLDFHAVAVTAAAGPASGRLGYERLEGNGRRGFTMPLSTAHAFNGWSDAFVQPLGGQKGFVDGLEDLNLAVTLRPPVLKGVELLVRRHWFEAERTGARLGAEWDVQAQWAITPKLAAALKYADFQRAAPTPGTAAPPASRAKLWLTVEYRY